MDWRVKAAIQSTLAKLPARMSYPAYYWMQRRFGALRRLNPSSQIEAAARMARAILAQGGKIAGGTCMEVGTGRRLNLPIVMWILGAERVITVDLNHYLKVELIAEDIAYLQRNPEDFLESLDGLEYQPNRLDQLLCWDVEKQGLNELLRLAHIEYLAPADATRLDLAANSIDFHVSSNVFEHIPRETLVGILREGNRVLRERGLFVHCIDHSDHFSHVDKSLPAFHFLRYNDRQWDRLAGNRYMYMNRLQCDDFEQIYAQSEQEVLLMEAEPDAPSLRQLQASAIPLDSRFASKPAETLATLSSMFVSRPSAAFLSRSPSSAA